jgi:hypothetical protein
MDDWKIEKTLLLEALLLRVAGSNSCQVLLQPSSGKQSIELSLDTIKQ